MNATTEDDQEQDPPDDAEAEEVHPEELEGELEVLLTQAAKKRAEIQKARGFSRSESSQAPEARIREMKSRMPCSACKAHGKTSFGHWHGDPECPYNKKGGQGGDKDKKVLAVVAGELSDSDDQDGKDGTWSEEVCASAVRSQCREHDRDNLALSDDCRGGEMDETTHEDASETWGGPLHYRRGKTISFRRRTTGDVNACSHHADADSRGRKSGKA